MEVPNGKIKSMSEDVFYHLGLDNCTRDLKAMFSDVKFVCMGGTASRMLTLARFLKESLQFNPSNEEELTDLTGHAHRYSMYKVGPVLCVNHGIGIPSITIVLHEIMKMLHHAQCTDVTFLRIGTSGGLGIEPGTVVISESAVDESLNPSWTLSILGRNETRPCVFDKNLLEELKAIGDVQEFPVVLGKSLATLDFYEGQARLDGAICNYSEDDKMAYLNKLRQIGVVNIEMECVAFGAFCHACGVKAAVINVTLLDRYATCQVKISKEDYSSWCHRPKVVAAEFIRRRLKL